MLVGSTIDQLHAMLRQHQALIVHFSGAPKGSGADTIFPDDLLYALAHPTSTELKCSTVMPGDYFHDDGARPRNAIGCVGLVVKLRGSHSLLDVGPGDLGSNLTANGRSVTLAECVDSIIKRKSYNEWIVKDYDVVGLFVAEPMNVSVLMGTVLDSIPGADTLPDYLKEDILSGTSKDFRETTVAELKSKSSFNGLRFYTFVHGSLAIVDSAWHAMIYP